MKYLMICMLVMACKTVPSGTDASVKNGSDAMASSSGSSELPLCTAITGNGQFLYSHFGALTVLLEDVGWIDMVAGGSSASVTSFLYSSLASSSLVRACGSDEACKRRRLAFMLKSLTGYGHVFGQMELDVIGLRSLSDWLRTALDSLGIEDGELPNLTPSGQQQLIAELFSAMNPNFQRVSSIIHPQVLKLVQMEKYDEVYRIISFPLQWKLAEQGMLIRPGLVNFKRLAELINRVALFYHGNTQMTQLEDIYTQFGAAMNQCLNEETNGSVPVSGDLDYWTSDNSCAQRITAIMQSYRTHIKTLAETSAVPTFLLDAPVGDTFPVLVHSAMVEVNTSNRQNVKAAYDSYYQYLENLSPSSSAPSPDLTYHSDFSDIKIGYWGNPIHLQKLLDASRDEELFQFSSDVNPTLYRQQWQVFSSKAMPFTTTFRTWRDALERSPAEPGLSSLVPTGDVFSAGGWPNGRAVHNLKRIGCQRVIAMTLSNISKYSVEVLNNLATNESDPPSWVKYYPRGEQDYTASAKSWWYKELDKADGVFCVDWGLFPQSKILERYKLGYEYFHFYDPNGVFQLQGNNYASRASARYLPNQPAGCILESEFNNVSPY